MSVSHLPIGLFLPGDSIIHHLDSRVKFLTFFISILSVICSKSLPGYGVMIGFSAFIIVLSGISLHTALNSVSRLYWFFIFIFLMNTCFFSPENAWFSVWVFNPSLDGMMQGFSVGFRMLIVLVISNVLTSTTAPLEVTKALESLISPLGFINIPTDQIAMILSVAIQFIPTLFEETDMIRKAQMARGARFDSPKLTEKAVAMLPLVVPIFLAAFKRAEDLSLAMEARGYRTGQGRTKKEHRPLRFPDYGALTVVSLICILQIYVF